MKPYYDRGGITIYHAEALRVLEVLNGIGAYVTDPPYSSGGQFRSDRNRPTIEKYVNSDSFARHTLSNFSGDNRDQRAYFAWSTFWMNQAFHASTPGAVLAVFSDWRQLPTTTDAVQAAGWIWRGLATWHKPGIRMQRGQFSASAEFVVFSTNGPRIDHDGAPQNVFSCAPIKSDAKQHVAQKPLDVMRWVLSAVPPGVIVCDPFMGSGTTLRAAKDAGHRAIGIEADERFCEVAANRLGQEVFDWQ